MQSAAVMMHNAMPPLMQPEWRPQAQTVSVQKTTPDAMSYNDDTAPWAWEVPLDTAPPELCIAREMWELMGEALPEDALGWANELMSNNAHIAGLPMLAGTSTLAYETTSSATKTSPAKIMQDGTNVKGATEEVIEAMFPKLDWTSNKEQLYSSRKRKQTAVYDPTPQKKPTIIKASSKTPPKKLKEKDLRCYEKAFVALPKRYPDKRFSDMPLPIYSSSGQRDRVNTFNNTMAWLAEYNYVKTHQENGSVKTIEVNDKPFFYKAMNMSLGDYDERDFELTWRARELMRYMALYPTEKLENGNHAWTCSVFKEVPELRRETSKSVCTLPQASWFN